MTPYPTNGQRLGMVILVLSAISILTCCGALVGVVLP